MAIPSGEVTRRDSIYKPCTVSGQGESHHVLVSVGFPYEKLWGFCDNFI